MEPTASHPASSAVAHRSLLCYYFKNVLNSFWDDYLYNIKGKGEGEVHAISSHHGYAESVGHSLHIHSMQRVSDTQCPA